jgi:4-amino-4-deoxy-L-arabinose transferase-like glycosyltransferase
MSSGERAASWRAWWIPLLLVAIVVLWFGKSAHRELVDPDEGRYAEIPREMLVSGDWVTPRLNDLKYFEKPPLQYWATAAAYRSFGTTEWTARLWVAITGLLCVLANWYAGRRLFGPAAGRCAALALLASPYFVIASAVNTLDMGVSCFLTLALYGYLLSRVADSPGETRRWMLVAWACMAAAVLSKGLIGIVLPAGALGLYWIWHRNSAPLRSMAWLPGLAVFGLLTVPWFVVVSRANPEFLHFFFVHEHWQRFASTLHHRTGPLWYYVPIVLVAIAPWAVAGIGGIVAAARARPVEHRVSVLRFLVCWCAVVFLFFSASQSKLPGYVLPMVPALALLAGAKLAHEGTPRAAFWIATGAMVFGTASFGIIEFGEGRVLQELSEAYETFSLWAETASMLFVLTGGIGLYWVERAAPQRLIAAMAIALFAALSLGIYGIRGLAPARSAQALAQAIHAAGPPGAVVYSVAQYDQTLPFYLGRTVTLVGYENEFTPGIQAEPHKHIAQLDDFRRRWEAERTAFAVLSPTAYAALRDGGATMTVMSSGPKRVLVRRH